MRLIKSIINRISKQGYYKIKSDGNSMYPLIKSGDIIRMEKYNFNKAKVNEIILISKTNQLIAHRVIYKKDKYLITKGDHNITADGRIKKNQIIGKVTQIKRHKTSIDASHHYLFQSSIYFQEIVRLNKIFRKNNLDFVYLKGLPLYLAYFKTHPSRFYADCDLMIRRDDLAKVSAILIQEKYRLAERAYSFVHKLLKDKPTELVFVKSVGNFAVSFDVHTEPNFMLNQIGKLDVLYPQFLIDQITDLFFQEKKRMTVFNEQFSVLSEVNLILYLALHLFHHNFKGIFRLELIDKLIRKFKNFDWVQLEKKIKSYRLKNFVYPVFVMSIKYYKTPVKRKFLMAIQPDGMTNKYIAGVILKTNVFNDQTRIEAGKTRFKNIFYLSSQPFYKKILVFFSPAVVYSIMWTLFRYWKKRRFFSFLNQKLIH